MITRAEFERAIELDSITASLIERGEVPRWLQVEHMTRTFLRVVAELNKAEIEIAALKHLATNKDLELIDAEERSEKQRVRVQCLVDGLHFYTEKKHIQLRSPCGYIGEAIATSVDDGKVANDALRAWRLVK